MKDILVCIFQRGGADGLNSLIPYTDEYYYRLRSRTALPPPGESGGALFEFPSSLFHQLLEYRTAKAI